MRYAKLGKVTSTVSLVALLAAAGMSTAQAATPALAAVNATVGVSSSVKMTPHIFEDTIITKQPLGPQDSGLCGEAGLVPIMPEDTIEVHYELRRDRVNAVANPGFAFDPTLNLQTEWILNPAYFSCPNPDMFIVHAIDEPWFDDLCGTDNDVTHLPANTDKYFYYKTATQVVAEETPGHIFQQDIVHAFPIQLSNEPCEVTPPLAPVTPVPAIETPVFVPAAPEALADPVSELTSAEALVAATVPTTITSADTSAEVVAASAPVSTTQLANTGVDGILRFIFGVALMAVAIGGMMLRGRRGHSVRR